MCPLRVSVSVLASDALGHDLIIDFISSHVRRLLNDKGSFDIDVGGSSAFLQR